MNRNITLALIIGVLWDVLNYLLGQNTILGFPVNILLSLGLSNDQGLITLLAALIIHILIAYLVITLLTKTIFKKTH